MAPGQVDIHLEPKEGKEKQRNFFKKDDDFGERVGRRKRGGEDVVGEEESKENLHPNLIAYTQKYLRMYYRSKYNIQ